MARILVIDDDPWILQMLSTALTYRGHQVDSATNGQEGFEKALKKPPELIITDVMMGTMDGWTLVRSMRSHAQLSWIPVIFLTALNSAEDRIRGFRLGADDYLSKPFRFEELDLRITRVFRSIERMRDQAVGEVRQVQANTKASFSGSLSHFGVSALLAMLEMERSSGILILENGMTARVFLRGGRVVAAILDGKGKAGAEVVYQVLGWGQGRFEFSSLEVDMDDQINASTTHLLMEGARLLDEASAVHKAS